MSGILERETKAERLEVRLTEATKSLLTHAAALRHTTVTEFLLSSAGYPPQRRGPPWLTCRSRRCGRITIFRPLPAASSRWTDGCVAGHRAIR